MIAEAHSHGPFRPNDSQRRELALDAAIVFRDRALDRETPPAECVAFRALMRRQAILWRRIPAPKSQA